MEVPSSKRFKSQHEDKIVFKLELSSTHTKDKESQSISFPEGNPPVTITRIKEEVEENFNIPVCVQSLSYDSCPLNDDASLEATRIRSGDTLYITYPAKGNCKEIELLVTWFEQVGHFLLTEDPTISNKRFSFEFHNLLEYERDQKLMHDMSYEYFYPWLNVNQPSSVNKLYFVSCGGLKVVMDVYAALLRHPWNDSLIELTYVQNGILYILWSIAETFELRRLIVSHNGLQLCIQSLLVEKVVVGECIVDKTSIEDEDSHSGVLVESIEGALGLLSK